MKKVGLLALLLTIVVHVAFGQTQSDKAVLASISKAASRIKTMECSFVQTKSLKMLSEKMVSKGNLTFQQPDRLRWEYTSPYKYAFVLNGNQVLIKKGSRTDKIDVNQSKVFKEIARMMMNTVTGKALDSSRDFKASVKTSSTEYVVTLTPQRKDVGKMFKTIKLHFNRKAEMVKKIEMTEQNGDVTIIELQNIKTNVSLPVTAFSAK